MGHPPPPRWCLILVALGLYLTLRGYHSFDGDQAYRLPLLLRQQDPSLYPDDPFVRSFAAFNPHRAYLVLLDLTSRPLGLPAGLALLFAATFALTFLGFDRLARSAWPGSGRRVGVVAVALALTAKAGNVGTNHLFESMLLDRLVALALGWVALAALAADPRRAAWLAPPCLGAAAWVHPSMGLLLALLAAACWLLFALARPVGEVRPRTAALGLALLGLALTPAGLAMAGQGRALLRGMDPGDYYQVAAFVQSPQHLIPHLWRWPQWLAWSCYPVLAGMSLLDGRMPPVPARTRVACLLGTCLAGLAVAWVGVEVVRDLRLTLFQPFRLATVARGLALVLVSGRLVALWSAGTWSDHLRAALLATGLSGDLSLVAATVAELGFRLGEIRGRRAGRLAGLAVLGLGLLYLARHDVESGHVRLLIAAVAGVAVGAVLRGRPLPLTTARLARLTALGWAVPLAALLLPAALGDAAPRWVGGLVAHCRFGMRPVDDVERLALWCRDRTPPESVFVGPPGPKTFRLWSRRSLAFNRAGSPYHAAGLADWAARFRDHVGFDGPLTAFARAYLDDRLGLERRYDALDPAGLAALARRQGASHVLASASLEVGSGAAGPLERLHVEGRYAVYRVRPPDVAGRPDASRGRLR